MPLSLAALLESLAAQIDHCCGRSRSSLLEQEVYGSFIYAQLRDPRTHDAIDACILAGQAVAAGGGTGRRCSPACCPSSPAGAA